MHVAKERVPVKMTAPGAVARQQPGFGDAADYTGISGEYFSLDAGTDIAPLLQGLDGDSCHSPHWGYLIGGEVVVTYRDQPEETCAGGDLFYWPPGHSIRVTEDAEVILFSPEAQHTEVIDHMADKLAALTS